MAAALKRRHEQKPNGERRPRLCSEVGYGSRGSGAGVPSVGTAAPPASELVRWSAFMPWAEITSFPLPSPCCTHGSSLAEGEGSTATCARLLDVAAQLSAPFPDSPLPRAQQRPPGQDSNCPEFGVELHSAHGTLSLSVGRDTSQGQLSPSAFRDTGDQDLFLSTPPPRMNSPDRSTRHLKVSREVR